MNGNFSRINTERKGNKPNLLMAIPKTAGLTGYQSLNHNKKFISFNDTATLSCYCILSTFL